MFSPAVRIILGIFGLAIAWEFYALDYPIVAAVMLAAVIFMIWGYFRYGTVFLILQHLKQKNYDKAQRALSQIIYPNLLTKDQKSYYYFAKGVIEYRDHNIDESFGHLSRALELGLRTENDTALALLKLADIELDRGNYAEAKKHLSSIASLAHKPELDHEIEKVQKKILEQSASTN